MMKTARHIKKTQMKMQNEIQMGDSTQTHDQSITWQSFNTMKTIVRRPVNPMPLELLEEDALIRPALLGKPTRARAKIHP